MESAQASVAANCQQEKDENTRQDAVYEGSCEAHPVQYVTWFGARAFCAWAGKRLCAEAEWERAAKGESDRLFPWGDAMPEPEHANVWWGGERNVDGFYFGTAPVGSYPAGASPVGCDDLSGNVAEFVEDDYHGFDEAGRPDDGTAWIGDQRSNQRVARGGSYTGRPEEVSAASRRPLTIDAVGAATVADGEHGFRCCLTLCTSDADCPGGEPCTGGRCPASCTPRCEGRLCGPDGCRGELRRLPGGPGVPPRGPLRFALLVPLHGATVRRRQLRGELRGLRGRRELRGWRSVRGKLRRRDVVRTVHAHLWGPGLWPGWLRRLVRRLRTGRELLFRRAVHGRLSADVRRPCVRTRQLWRGVLRRMRRRDGLRRDEPPVRPLLVALRGPELRPERLWRNLRELWSPAELPARQRHMRRTLLRALRRARVRKRRLWRLLRLVRGGGTLQPDGPLLRAAHALHRPRLRTLAGGRGRDVRRLSRGPVVHGRGPLRGALCRSGVWDGRR